MTTATASEPQIIESLTYPISPDYVRRNWTLERGIAEFVSNAIDADPKGYRFEWSDGVLVIEDFGPGVPEEGLVLGWSDKTNQQIGTWGEGLKIGSLVVARSNKVGRITVESVGYGFIPSITKGSPVGPLLTNGNGAARKGGIPLLRYDFFRSERERGTKITIEDCPEEVAEAVRSRFLYFDEDYQAPASPGRLVRGGERGRIYIGGVLVQENPKLSFSYDLALEEAKGLQNRDRTEVSGWKLDALCRAIRARAAEQDGEFLFEWAQAVIEGQLDDSEAHIDLTPAVRRGLAAVRKRLYGDRAVAYLGARDDSELELEWRDQGYTILRPAQSGSAYTFEQLMRAMDIPSVLDLARKPSKRRRPKTKWVALSKLTEAERANLEEAVRVVRGLYGPEAIDTYGVYSETSLEGVGENTAAGFYQPQGGKIGLHRDILASFERTLSVAIHEAAHRLRHRQGHGSRHDYGDRTRGFEEQLETMATIAALRLRELDAVPDPAAAQAEAEQDKGPGALVLDLIRDRMKQQGIKSGKALAEASGLTVHRARNLLAGRWAPTLSEAEAIEHALGISASVTALALQAEQLAAKPPRPEHHRTYSPNGPSRRWSFKRRNDGSLYRGKLAIQSEGAKALAERGGEWAELAELARQHGIALPNKNLDWLAPYRRMVELERERLAE